jgi:hypothetical protein
MSALKSNAGSSLIDCQNGVGLDSSLDEENTLNGVMEVKAALYPLPNVPDSST